MPEPEDFDHPDDFDTSERFTVERDTMTKPVDDEEIPDEEDFEVYIRDSETGETSMITFAGRGVEAYPAVKTGDFLYGAVEEAKAHVASNGYDIGDAVKVI